MVFVDTINNFLSKEECQLIIDNNRNNTFYEGKVREDDLNYKERKSEIQFINLPEISNKIKNLLEEKYKLKNFTYSEIEKFQFTKYTKDGHYTWHIDASDTYKGRFLSCVILLNDDFVGGELLYKDNDYMEQKFEKRVGNLFIFNSRVLHSVSKVLFGERYSLVCWVKIKQSVFKKTLL